MKQEELALKTKKALANSLKNAMKKKPFSKITVKEITDDCNLNRNTFYYHFEDIYDLLRWMFDSEAVQIVQSFNLLMDYKDAIAFVIDYVEKNDHIISCALDSIGQKELKRFFYNDFFDIVSSLLEDAQKQFHVSLENEYKAFLTDFFTEAFAGILIEWIAKKDTMNKDKLILHLSATIKNSLYGIFQVSPFLLTQEPPRM